MGGNSDLGTKIQYHEGAPWSPFGIYSALVINQEFGQIPKTAVRVRLPEKLERVVGEFYMLNPEDRRHIRRSTSEKMDYYFQESLARVGLLTPFMINPRDMTLKDRIFWGYFF